MLQSVTFRFRRFLIFGIGKNLVSKKVSDLVSKKIGIQKSIGFGIGNNLVSKKVWDSVSEIFGIEKSLALGIEKNYQKNLGFVTDMLCSMLSVFPPFP